jgi:methionyl-tRNA synthetase
MFLQNINGGQLIVLIILVIWSIIWKGLALWKSAQRQEKIWFIIFLVVNSMGILEIIYLIINRKDKSLTK